VGQRAGGPRDPGRFPVTTDDGLRAFVTRHGTGSVVRAGPAGTAPDVAGAGTVVWADWPPPGREAAHRRLLGDLRRAMSPAGVLIIEQRLRGPSDLAALVRCAGYAVEHTEFAGAGVRLVARPLPAPPESLAVSAWGEELTGIRLDLRYADDEAEWMDPSPAEVWAALASEGAFDADTAGHYPVDDPFGSRRGAPVVSRFFGRTVPAERLFFGAGVTGLLRDLADLAEGGVVLTPAYAHPDLPALAVRRGATVHAMPEPAAPLLDEIARTRPDLLLLDQPGFGGRPYPLDELVAASHAVPAVVVDESAAPYLGPGGSAVTVAAGAGNLVVLRGFTKAYSWGGLRAGFAVASPGLEQRVRELVTPLQIGELALRAALGMLAAGDVLKGLRERIRAVKPPFTRRLAEAGLAVVPGHEDIPWVVIQDGDGSHGRFLAGRGIRGLAPSRPGQLRLTVPLSDRRIALFHELLGP
jgi:histidinol-phosphate/aromatic aminotransferase/cobyric acid decarboxylase-like protein